MTEYDAAVAQKFVDRLYRRANSIIVVMTLLGLLLGLGLGAALANAQNASGESGVIIMISAAICSFIGYAIGAERAFMIKLQAQILLCQMKIEKNTGGKIV